MIKKVIFIVTIVANVILAVVFVINLAGAKEKLQFEYVEQDTIRPDSLWMYLDMETLFPEEQDPLTPFRGN